MINASRIFVGLKLSGYFVDTIPMIKSTIDDKKNLISWVSGKNLHLTLSFLGESSENQIEDLKMNLNEISESNSFEMIVNGTGAFPSLESPKILWLDIQKGNKELISLQLEIQKLVTSFKQNSKKENFIPHITIGRIKNMNKNINLDLSTFSNAVYSDVRIPVKTIYLFKSQLVDSSVEYSVISQYSLK